MEVDQKELIWVQNYLLLEKYRAAKRLLGKIFREVQVEQASGRAR